MNCSAEAKSSISNSGLRLAATAMSPVASTAEVRRKLRRLMPASGAASGSWAVGVGMSWGGQRFRRVRGLRRGVEQVRTGGRFAAGKMRRVRIVAVHAVLLHGGAHRGVPKSVDPTVGPGFPVAIRGAVAAAAKLGAVLELQFAAVARLQQREVIFVVAVETIIVPAVRAVR